MLIDPQRERGQEPDDGLILALRALPPEQVPEDGWATLAAELQRRTLARPRSMARKNRRRLGWLAVAAVLLVALVLPHRPEPGPVDSLGPIVSVVEDGSADLIAHSQWLERLLAAPMLESGVQDADQLLIEVGLRERIGAIDAALAVSTTESDAQPLWQARVDALSQLAQVRWAGQQTAWLATAGQPDSETSTLLWSN